jgi:hypothetical protein
MCCKQCGACCWRPHPECAKKNLTYSNGKYWCKIHERPEYPQGCKDYNILNCFYVEHERSKVGKNRL